jgi:hypothetical protein
MRAFAKKLELTPSRLAATAVSRRVSGGEISGMGVLRR